MISFNHSSQFHPFRKSYFVFQIPLWIKGNVILILLFMSINILAQSPEPDFKDIDKKTYQLFLLKDWDSLISYSKNILNENIDYFYLRSRIGIAYFEKTNYFKAAYHFEKALQFNSNDTTILEYLYYCYLYTNRKLEAVKLIGELPKSLKNKVNFKSTNNTSEIYLETGPTFSNNIDKNQTNDLIRQDSLYGEQDLNGDKYYFHLGLKQRIGKRFSFYLGYSNLSVSKLKQIQATEIVKSGYDTIPYKGWNYIDTIYKKKVLQYDDNYKLYQNQLYLNANITLGKGFTLIPAFHCINIRYKTIYASSELEEYYAQSYNTIPSLKTVYTIKEIDTAFNNYIGSIGLYKNISVFNIGLFSTVSNLNGLNQFQFGGSFTWFPKGNLDLYTTTSIISAWEGQNNRIVFEQLLGIKILPKLWIEGQITLGEIKNYNEKNAFVVHNSGDIIKLRACSSLILTLSDKIELSVLYQYFNMEGYRTRYTNENSIKTTGLNYQNQTLIGGIKWKLYGNYF